MIDITNVLKAWECCVPFNRQCSKCPYDKVCYHDGFSRVATSHAMGLLKKQQKEIKKLKTEKNE